MKKMGLSVGQLAETLRRSEELSVDSDGSYVRRRVPYRMAD